MKTLVQALPKIWVGSNVCSSIIDCTYNCNIMTNTGHGHWWGKDQSKYYVKCRVPNSVLYTHSYTMHQNTKDTEKEYDLALYRRFSGIKVYVFVRPPPQSPVGALETD